MTIAKVDSEQWFSGLETAMNHYKLIGPTKQDFGYSFDFLDKVESLDLRFSNTVISPKGIIFPQSERIIKFIFDDYGFDKKQYFESMEKKNKPNVLIGIRPCDAKANTILKMNFDTNEIKDPFWLNLYNSTTFIGFACDSPCKTCFCTSVNSSPYGVEGLDIIFSLQEGSYILKTITQKGEDFLNIVGWNKFICDGTFLNFEEFKVKAEKKMINVIEDDFKGLEGKELLHIYNSSFWNEISFACINCGMCTYGCPTCWCFDIQDEVYEKSGFRIKNWDSCMFPIFTLHTTGHNPRGNKKDRFRQRFMHKLKYFLDKYKNGIMCVGCGRCVKSCPVNIDIRKVIELMISF